MAKRGRIIEVSTSEEAAEESEQSRGMSDREQSWRYVIFFLELLHFLAPDNVVAHTSNVCGNARKRMQTFHWPGICPPRP